MKKNLVVESTFFAFMTLLCSSAHSSGQLNEANQKEICMATSYMMHKGSFALFLIILHLHTGLSALNVSKTDNCETPERPFLSMD